ncbi:MAG: ABC transporter substrate-binding protein, partial [Acidiferrobacterales bacterium]|nr:ABC transporter substrate-binding protein [Acidiferrobacterales bacterium]
VVFNFERWLDPATGSSNIGLFAAMVEETSDGNKKMTSGAVEKVDDHTVRLNLNSAVLAIPENLFNYPTAILHRKFEEMGSDLSKNPIGTGPYELVDFAVGERAILRRRDGYWGKAPFLDEIHYIDTGQDPSARIAALASGQVDGIYEIDVTQIDVLDRVPNAVVHEAVTAQTAVARMQVDQEPFTDPKVRQALVACMDHQKLLDISYRGRGAPAENHHVSPIHPEYAELPPLPHPDIEKAKQLLSEAGFADGIELSIDVGQTSGAWELACIQALKQQCAPAGINLQINNLPSAQYWEIWDKTPFGFTSWTHRPLGVMVLNLGYRSGVPWNESHYANPAFDAALDEASSILDVNERRKVMAKVQKILQDDAVIAQPLWRAVFSATSDKVEFYKSITSRCKECHKAKVRENRASKVEYYRSYDAKRFQEDPKVKERHRRYQATEAGKKSMARAKAKWDAENPEKKAAHSILRSAVKSGKICKPETCQDCGSGGRIHGHHEDYTRPIDVEWLCPSCHAKRHNPRHF